jgi:hypothetical protein
VDEAKLVNVALNGFTKSWESFLKQIYAQEKLADWHRIWNDSIQEDTWEESKAGKQEDRDKTWLWSVIPRGEKDRFLVRRT